MPAAAASRPRTRRRSGPPRRQPARGRAPRGIRWDRVGRVALLCVLGLVLYLYIGPTRTWFTTWRESKQRAAELRELKHENAALRARRDELKRPGTLEAEARALGMVRAGEKAYVIRGLPGESSGAPQP